MPQHSIHSPSLSARAGSRRLARLGLLSALRRLLPALWRLLPALWRLLPALWLLLPALAAPAMGADVKPKPIRPIAPPPPPVPLADRMHPGLPRFQMEGGRLILPCVLVEPGAQGATPKAGEAAPPYVAAYRAELQLNPQTKTLAIIQVAPVMDVNSNPACLGNAPSPRTEAPRHQKKTKHN